MADMWALGEGGLGVQTLERDRRRSTSSARRVAFGRGAWPWWKAAKTSGETMRTCSEIPQGYCVLQMLWLMAVPRRMWRRRGTGRCLHARRQGQGATEMTSTRRRRRLRPQVLQAVWHLPCCWTAEMRRLRAHRSFPPRLLPLLIFRVRTQTTGPLPLTPTLGGRQARVTN